MWEPARLRWTGPWAGALARLRWSLVVVWAVAAGSFGCAAATNEDAPPGRIVIREGGTLPELVEPAAIAPHELAITPEGSDDDGANVLATRTLTREDAIAEGSDFGLSTTPDLDVVPPDQALPVEEPAHPVDLGWDLVQLPPPAARNGVGREGAELTAGGYSALIPAQGEPIDVELVPQSPADIRQPQPLSVALAIAELHPLYHVSEDTVALTFPLEVEVEPGTPLWLLSFSRSMDAFNVVAHAVARDDGTAVFHTDVFSQYVVVAEPQLVELACNGGPFDMHQRYPGGPEVDVVGEVEEAERLQRDDAFSVLSDLRYFPDGELILFKNEEANNDGTAAPYDNEDFLLDPRLAHPLTWLGQAVREQWVDPVGGGAFYEVRLTDGYDSLIEHSRYSNHYRGLAADLTVSPVPAASDSARNEVYGLLSRLSVCAGFDFVHFENRYHVHVSSRPARLAYLEETDTARTLVVSRLDGTHAWRFPLGEGLLRDLAQLDVRHLSFADDGNAVIVIGRNKGALESYRLDLRTETLRVEPPPDDWSEGSARFAVDPSLVVESDREGVRLVRPAPLADGTLAPDFPLTPPGVRGRLAVVWSAPVVDRDVTATTLTSQGEPSDE